MNKGWSNGMVIKNGKWMKWSVHLFSESFITNLQWHWENGEGIFKSQIKLTTFCISNILRSLLNIEPSLIYSPLEKWRKTSLPSWNSKLRTKICIIWFRKLDIFNNRKYDSNGCYRNKINQNSYLMTKLESR